MDPEYLSDLVLGTGVVVTLISSFLAAPAATRHLTMVATSNAKTAWTLVRARVKRVWLRLTGRNEGAVVALLPAMAGFAAGKLTVTGEVGWAVDAHGDVESRLVRLETRIIELRRLATDNQRAIQSETGERRAEIERLEQRIADEAAAIRAGISAMEEVSRRGDVRVLPVLGLGVVLTAIPDTLAHATWLGSPVLAGVIGIIAGLFFLERALIHFWQTGTTQSS